MAFGNEKCKEIVENICPHCGEILIMNKRSFANHVRWCKKNPMYNEIKQNTITNIKKKVQEHRLENDGPIIQHSVKCYRCGKEFIVNEPANKFPMKDKYFCSSRCSHSRDIDPNKIRDGFKNKSQKYLDYYKKRYNGSLPKDRVSKICKYCGEVFHTRKEKQFFCSNECSIKYKREQKYKNADKDLILKYYKKCCEFTFALNDYPDEFDFNLIKKYGWYKAKNHGNNLNGVSRDHIYSRNMGFENLIDPYLISHPANCQLLKHNDNVSKYINCDITLEDLIVKVDNWDKKYGEYPNKIDYSVFENNGIKFKYRYHI